MTYDVPPATSPPKKPDLALKLLIAFSIASVLLCTAALGVLVYALSKAKGPRPAEHFGRHEVLATTDGDWVRVRMPDLGWTLELPAEPEPSPQEGWDAASKVLISRYAHYNVEGEALNAFLLGYRYRTSTADMTAKELADEEESQMRDSPGVTDLETTSKERRVAGRKAVEVRQVYLLKGDWSERRVIYFQTPRSMLVLGVDFFRENEEEALREYERILRSIKFEVRSRR